MSATNKKAKAEKKYTHGGAPATLHVTPYQELRRTVLAAFLFEDQFYESGESIANRIRALSDKVSVPELAALAIEARHEQNLRHVSLMLLVQLIRRGRGRGKEVAAVIAKVVSRADELAELVSMYWAEGKKPLAKSMKLGLGAAFNNFGEYNFAKYNRDTTVKLRDVLFLVHPKAKDEAQQKIFDKIASNTLPTPDTWEVGLSSGADGKETFERLIKEGKMGYLALLRNLRNFEKYSVDVGLVKEAILARKGGAEKVLPFRFVAAARAAPRYERELDKSLLTTIEHLPKLKGTTLVLVDVSGSMGGLISNKSDLSRMDAAAALASMVNGDDVRVFSFSDNLVEVPYRRGMAGVDAIKNSQRHSGTAMAKAVAEASKLKHDRIIVITDEQATGVTRSYYLTGGAVGDPAVDKAYMINVGSYQNGVGYGKWVTITGFSEKVFQWVAAYEALADETYKPEAH